MSSINQRWMVVHKRKYQQYKNEYNMDLFTPVGGRTYIAIHSRSISWRGYTVSRNEYAFLYKKSKRYNAKQIHYS